LCSSRTSSSILYIALPELGRQLFVASSAGSFARSFIRAQARQIFVEIGDAPFDHAEQRAADVKRRKEKD
jgi:hypothetical protein